MHNSVVNILYISFAVDKSCNVNERKLPFELIEVGIEGLETKDSFIQCEKDENIDIKEKI